MSTFSPRPYAPIPMVPGPVTVHPAVIAAMCRDYGSGDIEQEFLPLYVATGRALARLMGTRNDVVIMTGEGMLSLWAGLKNALCPGDKVLSVGTGLFGNGFAAMARAIGCEVELLSFPADTTIGNGESLTCIEDALRRFHPKMITAVHCETPSGTLNPLAELGQMKERLGIPLFCVDAVSSIGGAPVQADAWHIDLVFGGSQKCLGAPPAMSFLSLSPAAWEHILKNNYQGYDALAPFHNLEKTGLPPYTPYWHGLAALHAAVSRILDEGPELCFARHRRVAAMCRQGLTDVGITLFPKPEAVPSPTVTAAYIPEGFTWPEWNQRLRALGLVAGGNYEDLAGKVFRLGHMGPQADEELMGKALAAIRQALEE